jgi:hypothetical protein
MNDIQEEQTEVGHKLMEKLNTVQEQQADAAASELTRSVLMYGAQERVLDRLTTLEEKMDGMIAKILDVSE